MVSASFGINFENDLHFWIQGIVSDTCLKRFGHKGLPGILHRFKGIENFLKCLTKSRRREFFGCHTHTLSGS